MKSGSSRLRRSAFAILTAFVTVLGASSFLIAFNASAAQPVVYEGPKQSTSGPLAPTSVSEAGPTPSNNYVMIEGVPSYGWYNGCGPTAVGMVVGYWDGHGFDDLVPGSASVQNQYVNNMIASADHIADYALPHDDYYTGLLLDKSSLGGAHSSNCVADFMHTSWSSDGNMWGWTWSDMIDDGFSGYVAWANPAYSVATAWVIGSSLTWERYVHEIDSGHPAVFLVDSEGDGYTDHFVTAIGYGQIGGTKMYACYDTWYSSVRWCEFARMSKNQPFGVYDGTFFELTKNEAYCASKTWGVGTTSVSWTESVTESYTFSVLMDNNGFKSAVVEVFDTTNGKMMKVFHETVNMRYQNAYPFGWASTTSITLKSYHTYKVWIGSLDGPVGSYLFAYPTPIAPVASFTYSGAGLTITADAAGSYDLDGYIVGYTWDWGDGGTGSGKVATHTYGEWSAVTVTLTVTDDDGSKGTTSKHFPIWPFQIWGLTYARNGMPLPDCAVVVSNLRTGSSLTTASGSDAYYQVDFNRIPGGWVGGDTVRVTATKGAAVGSKEVVLVENTPFLRIDVTVQGPIPPVAAFSWTLSGRSLSVDASNSYDPDGTIVQYVWLWGDGTVTTGVTSSHYYPSSGTRYVTLTVTDNDGLTCSLRKSAPPLPPYMVAGYTYGPDGATPLTDCIVVITNLRTGASMTSASDSVYGYYQANLNNIPGDWASGDVIRVTATKGTLIGSNAGIANENSAYLPLNVVLVEPVP